MRWRAVSVEFSKKIIYLPPWYLAEKFNFLDISLQFLQLKYSILHNFYTARATADIANRNSDSNMLFLFLPQPLIDYFIEVAIYRFFKI